MSATKTVTREAAVLQDRISGHIRTMDFIEQLFGVSPDNGDGTTEVLWLVVLAILLGAALLWKRHGAVPSWRSRRSLQSRLGIEAIPREQATFTCTARTRVGDQEAVIVIGNVDLPDAIALVGATVLIDGASYAVYDVAPRENEIRKGQPVMMRVRKLG